jgi:hypothetical protein
MKKLKYILEPFRWIKALFSPFTPFKVSWYIGKTQIGTPYFLPRKWIKATPELATKAALKQIESSRKWNERNPDSKFKHTIKSFDEVYQEKLKYRFPVPLKVGFSMNGLGWKTKWDQYDIRHEWNPVISFVFFGYQIAATFYHPHQSHYWESWICYEYCSDKKQSKRERIAFCRKKCPQTWTSHKHNEKPVTTDYWDLILKTKYL